MMTEKIPVLLTSSVIAYDAGIALSNTQDRIALAMTSIAQWLKIDPELPLVLCDGSNFDFTTAVAQHFPGARIECLHFENDQRKVKQYGRGFGEGEIVRYAIRHSSLIGKAGCFAKCTSKLWVSNYLECLSNWNGVLLCKGVFLDVFSLVKRIRFAYIDTRFYIASVAAYRQYFEAAHLRVNAQNGHSLEDCFFDIFIEKHLTHCLLAVPPVIEGVGGGTGTSYRNPLKRRIKERLRLKIVRSHKRFSHLFVRPT